MAGAPPAGAPPACPGGPGSAGAGEAEACAGCPSRAECAGAAAGGGGGAAAGEGGGAGKAAEDAAAVGARLAGVGRVVMVLSGKGGVGKSTVSAQLGLALAARGHEVGLLDVDICGPSLPRMLGLEGEEIHQSGEGWSPVYAEDNLAVMSIGFMLPNKDDAVVWRGPRKNGLITQFLRDVDWGELDYLVVDTPPGTSDEHISLAQLLQGCGRVDGAVMVTTPQEVAVADVRKEIGFCRKTGIRVLGVVENMAGLHVPAGSLRFFAGPDRGQDVTADTVALLREKAPEVLERWAACDVFPAVAGGAAALCKAGGLELLGRVPLSPEVSLTAEEGGALGDLPPGHPSRAAFASVVDRLLELLPPRAPGDPADAETA